VNELVSHWRVLAASTRGASHAQSGAPNQDSNGFSLLRELDDESFVVSVADGHGDRRHFRSERGSRFATDIACSSVLDNVEQIAGSSSAIQLEGFAKSILAPGIVQAWRERVEADVDRDPFVASELHRAMSAENDPELAYGSTLLLAMVCRQWVLLVQIGDGDAIVIHPNGSVRSPVPGDSRLDGRQTTSLCQVDAVNAFRIAVVDRSEVDVAGILLATDGFGNAQVADPWEPAFGADLVDMVRDRGMDWIEGQLPLWVEECASSGGSADDTTVALVLASAMADTANQSTTSGPREREATTVVLPGRSPEDSDRTQMLPAGMEGGNSPAGADQLTVQIDRRPPAEVAVSRVPTGRSSNMGWKRVGIVAGVLVVVAIVLALVVTGSGPSHSPPPTITTTSRPSLTTTRGSTPTITPNSSPAATQSPSPSSTQSPVGQGASTTTNPAAQPLRNPTNSMGVPPRRGGI
jgi:Protein phosphatase 2C